MSVWATLGLVLGVAAVFFAPFALFLGRGTFSGRRMLAVAVGMFGMIIAVNLVMAFRAVGTFPGLEVANSYVASQTFDRDRAAQQALGWTARPGYDGAVLSLALTGADGAPAKAVSVTANVARPTSRQGEVVLPMVYEAGLWTAPVVLAEGAWVLHLEAIAADGTRFRQRLRVPGHG